MYTTFILAKAPHAYMDSREIQDNILLGPLVCSINSTTHNIGKHITTILAPLVGNTTHHINKFADFTIKIKDFKFELDEIMVSFDVTSLFICIPTTETVETVRRKPIQERFLLERTDLTTEHICSLLDHLLPVPR